MDPLALLTVVAYGGASLGYLLFLTAGRQDAGRLARWGMAAGVLLQFADIGRQCVHLRSPISSTPDVLAFVGWLMALGFLAASLRYGLTAAGGFAAPAALVLVLMGRVLPSPPALHVEALGRAHIFLASLGEALFALAAVLAVVYLVEERAFKRREFGRLLGRGAPLDTLDRLAGRCVTLGFPVFTVAVITGAVWVAERGDLHAGSLRIEYALAVLTWLVFGVLLVARAAGGWRGRRLAWLTLGGFGGAVAVLGAYLLRHAA